MIVIKGNLFITRQARISNSSETSSDKSNNIVAFADLSTFDTSNATVLVGDIVVDSLADTILVTGEVVEEGGTV